MARDDQLSRQWRILRMLEESRRGFTVSELARELNCVRRTVYRDLEILQEAGFPIYTERDGRASRWAFIDTFRFHLPVPFSSIELMALYFSRDLLSVFEGTIFYEDLESLFGKVKSTLPRCEPCSSSPATSQVGCRQAQRGAPQFTGSESGRVPPSAARRTAAHRSSPATSQVGCRQAQRGAPQFTGSESGRVLPSAARRTAVHRQRIR
ncbi:MAG: helix-turn-helix transcriptional regulator [Syntrophobacteria bacterium]